jgi:hypothetical protein
MIDNAVLRERIQAEPDSRVLTGDQADQVTQELKVLARILIDAVKEERRRGKAS